MNHVFRIPHDIVSANVIKPCIKIYKPQMVYIFSNIILSNEDHNNVVYNWHNLGVFTQKKNMFSSRFSVIP